MSSFKLLLADNCCMHNTFKRLFCPRGESNSSWAEVGVDAEKLSGKRWYFLLYFQELQRRSRSYGYCLQSWISMSSDENFKGFWSFLKYLDWIKKNWCYLWTQCQKGLIHNHSVGYSELLLFNPGAVNEKGIFLESRFSLWLPFNASKIREDLLFDKKWRQIFFENYHFHQQKYHGSSYA